MPASSVDFMDRIRAAVDTEFAPEGLVCLPDRLHEAITHQAAGVSVDNEVVTQAGIVNRIEISLQVFQAVDLQIDPEQQVDPGNIIGWAHRLMRRFQSPHPVSGNMWSTLDTDSAYWFNLVAISYPLDPTGNKTRFEMDLDGFGDNPSLVETTA